MYSEKEILEALNILKSVCEENSGNCRNCMLRNGDNWCGVISNSSGDCYDKIKDWELKNYNNPRLILS